MNQRRKDAAAIDIAKGLCAQYATNENHRQSIILTFLSVLIAGSTAYGIVLKKVLTSGNITSYCMFFLVTVFVLVVFMIPVVFSIILGYNLRRDQLVVDKIRYNIFRYSWYRCLFGSYNPVGTNVCCKFLQDFNKAIIWFSVFFQFLALIIFIVVGLHELGCSLVFCCYLLASVFVLFIVWLTQVCVFCCYKSKYAKKYDRYIKIRLRRKC